MEEIWKDIKDYEGLYQVSNLGRIKSLNYRKTGREKILKPKIDNREGKGYQRVGLCKNGVKWYLIHRLVAKAFIQNPNNLPQVNHKDEDKQNNCVENLEWCDHKYNVNYGTAMERTIEKQRNNKYSKPVLQIDKNTNEVIAEFPSIHQAERDLGIRKSSISKCCNGKLNTARGFKWAFKKEDY